MEEQGHVVFFYGIVVVEVVVDDAPVPIDAARGPVDVRHPLDHKRDGARGENGMLEVESLSTTAFPRNPGRRQNWGGRGPL